MYWYWLYSPDTCIHVLTGTWLYSRPHCTLPLARLTLPTWYIYTVIDTWLDIWFCTDWLYYCIFMFYMLFLSCSSIYYHHMLTHVICTCTFPFILTHLLGRFLTNLNLHIQIGCLISLSGVELVRFTRIGASFYSILVFLLLFYSCYSWFFLYRTQLPFHFLFIWYHVWTSICSIAVIWFIVIDFIACSDYFRFSVYTWGILLTYIRRRLSPWLCFHIFWEAGRDRVILVSKPGSI